MRLVLPPLLLLLLPPASEACYTHEKGRYAPYSLGVDPTAAGPPTCVSVQTGACKEVFGGTDTSCVEEPPAALGFSAQQYIDLMGLLDNSAMVDQLAINLPPYGDCLVDFDDAVRQVACQTAFKEQASTSGCVQDLKRLLCMAGARPCRAGPTPADDTRLGAPCEWCLRMIMPPGTRDPVTNRTRELNACSSDAAKFDFHRMYEHPGRDQWRANRSGGVCYETLEYLDVPATQRVLGLVPSILRSESLKTKDGAGIARMLAYGLDSALKGCNYEGVCPTGPGMATGLWAGASDTGTATPSTFRPNLCPERGDGSASVSSPSAGLVDGTGGQRPAAAATAVVAGVGAAVLQMWQW